MALECAVMASARHSLVVVNPNAAKLHDAPRRAELISALQATLRERDAADPSIVETRDQSDTAGVVQAGLADGARSVVGVGGDGTLRDIAAGLANSGVPLGIIPAGTGNQMAAALGIPLKPGRAVEALARAHPRIIDLGYVTLHREDAPDTTDVFTIGCGTGFDARLMATTPSAWKRRLGSAAYFLQALRLAARITAVPYRIAVDGELIETEASVVLAGNMGQLVPGRLGLRLPLVPDDGQLDIIVVGARGPLEGLRGLADQLRRTAPGGGSGSSSIRLRGRQVSVTADRPEPMEVDGDYVGTGSLEAYVEPAAVEVLVPTPGV